LASIGAQTQVAEQPQTNFFFRDSVARTVILSLLLAIAAIAIYSPVNSHPFANIDDPKYVVDNPHIKDGPTLSTIVWAFTHGYAANWHPLTWISHAVDIRLFGYDPAGHHDENVLLHAINALLLFLVLKRATGYTWRSFMVAALFALHPMNVESVAWIAERKTMLSTLFCLLALGAYQWYASKPGIVRYTVMAGLFVLGLMSKPQIIMLPLVLLLWDYWPLQRMFADERQPLPGVEAIPPKSLSWLIKEKFPLFFICIVDAGVTLMAQHVTGGAQPFTLWIRIENALVSYTRYIRKAFWPSDLALYYPHPGRTLLWWQVGASALMLLLITVLAARARKHRYLIVGWLWFLIMLVPMIGLVQADVQGMADRYAYVSFMGLFIMVCWGLGDWVAERHLPRALLSAVSLVALAALSGVTCRQISYWQDNVTLWSHSAEVTTGNWKAEFLLGSAQDAAGLHDAAAQSYQRAASINPTDPFINLNIAAYEQNHRNLPLAIEYYKKVLPQAWNSDQRAQALTNMAASYRQMGDYTAANECMAKLNALPQRKMDWQGAWWQQIIPMIKQYLHMGSSNPQS
jgi:tetratricopeptide (TPR) repeat protein